MSSTLKLYNSRTILVRKLMRCALVCSLLATALSLMYTAAVQRLQGPSFQLQGSPMLDDCKSTDSNRTCVVWAVNDIMLVEKNKCFPLGHTGAVLGQLQPSSEVIHSRH